MYNGFRNDYYNGRRIFVRSEYERVHSHMSDKERLEELTGKCYRTLLMGIMDCYNNNRALIYREYESSLDFFLRKTINISDLWHPYKSGFIHEITGEYLPDTIIKPQRDSWPAWAIFPKCYEHSLLDTFVDLSCLLLSISGIEKCLK